uniref:Cytosol aminopeptidase domain-containing protein n=1 Tax=Acrobeloides nanus TaxID=290746 RepID=A0A914DUM4_9BILA
MSASVIKSLTRLGLAEKLHDPIHDGVIIIGHCIKEVLNHPALSSFSSAIESYANLHQGVSNTCSVVLIPTDAVPSKRLIYASVGSVSKDFDDVRRYLDAGKAALKGALEMGVKFPLLITLPIGRFPHAEFVAAMGGINFLYVPLNIRESGENHRRIKLENFNLFPLSQKNDGRLLKQLEAIQTSFTVTRDIGESDPIRMAPPRVAEYVKQFFEGTAIKVHVESDPEIIKREYPLMAAVNRCANVVESHQARLIWLEYENTETPERPVDFETLMLVGKGVTIDTGGTDLKIGGSMFGMARDKYGAAVLAGFFSALNILRPKGIKVIGAMAMVRNSIGADAYTCDEIITARSGKRIHIYNTDAEGRITMLDPLTKMREIAIKEKNPHLMTLATLTGHAYLTYGTYAAVMDNGPARAQHYAQKLQATGDEIGQPVEISRLHAEDLEFNNSEIEGADLKQGLNKASVQTLRGHFSPGGFLIRGSRIDEYGLDSENPLKYTHFDMGSAMNPAPLPSFPNPLLTLIAHHILPRV